MVSYVSSNMRLLWERITLSRITKLYFIFSVVHCILQVSFEIKAFTTNAGSESLLSDILVKGKQDDPGFAAFGKDGLLRWCTSAPSGVSSEGCPLVWDGSKAQGNAWQPQAQAVQPASSSVSVAFSTSAPFATPVTSAGAVASAKSASASASGTPVRDPAAKQTIRTTKFVVPSATGKAQATATPSRSAGTSSTSVTSALAAAGTAPPAVDVAAQVTVPDVADAVSGTTLNNAQKKDADDDLLKKRKTEDVQVQGFEVAGSQKVALDGLGPKKVSALLDVSCIRSLKYPVEMLRNTKREDIVFITFQFWVLGMSTVALLNESIPHIFASLLTHLLATAYAGFQISNTHNFRQNFRRLTLEGACAPVNLLPDYWQGRQELEITIFALNVFALFVSGFLSWKLVKAFGWQTFKRVGASLTIRRVYMNVLVLSITIQLSLYFMCTASALWIDQLINGAIGSLSPNATLFKILFAIVSLSFPPWLAMGWFAVRKENRIAIIAFLALSVVYLVGWNIMFLSNTFRWTFIQWRFFSIVSSVTVFLTLMSFVMGIVCRLGFGKGLFRYLNAEERLEDETTYGQDAEKLDFPVPEKPIPTFAAAYPAGVELPSQMGTYGPTDAQNPFADVSAPAAAHSRAPSNASTIKASGGDLERQNSRASERSVSSTNSSNSASSQSSGQSRSKRWVIE